MIDERDADDNIGQIGPVGDKYSIQYQYDPRGKIASVLDQNSYTVNYAYHVNGQREAITVADPDETEIYNVSYDYDPAGRLDAVYDDASEIVTFEYDNNGNRKNLNYHLGGTSTVSFYLDYGYNIDNRLIEFETKTGGPTFSFDATTAGDIDGMGRLVNAVEELTDTLPAQNTVTYAFENVYDRLSRLKSSKQTLDLDPQADVYYEHVHTYDDAGNMTQHEYDDNGSSDTTLYDFTGNQVIGDTGNNFEVAWDNNGRQTSQWCDDGYTADYKLDYDFEGRLREAFAGSANDKMIAKYTPGGARVYKERIWSDDSDYKHKYIVDVASKLPKILLVLDADNNDAVIKKYIHAQDQVIAQHDIINDTSTPPEVVSDNLYFYLHDRLGSVRQIIDTNGDVVNAYTYDPWGLPITSETDDTIGHETKENISNPYQFANYIYDAEIKMYYCNAREYDPVLTRFTSRDPVLGTFENPMTLHAYLYCLNDPINHTDPSGKFLLLDQLMASKLMAKMRAASAAVGAVAYRFAERIYGLMNFAYLRLNIVINRMSEAANSYWPSPEQGRQVIRGVNYSTEALRRMAPVGSQWLDPVRQIFVAGRGVPPSVVENAILYGETTVVSTVEVKIVYENVTVFLNPLTNLVITVIKTGH